MSVADILSRMIARLKLLSDADPFSRSDYIVAREERLKREYDNQLENLHRELDLLVREDADTD